MPVNYESKYNVSEEDLTRLRDERHLSWAKVAETLELGSPGTARRVYSELVRPHHESVLPTKGERASGQAEPMSFTDDSDPATIQEAVEGQTVVVQRARGQERIRVVSINSVGRSREGKRTVNFKDPEGKNRSVHATRIVAVAPM